MTHRQLFLKFLVFMVAFIACGPSPTNAHTVESVQTLDSCRVDDAIYSVEFSPDGQYVMANWPPHSIRVWNAQSGATVATLTDDEIDNQELIAFSPDNTSVLTGGNRSVVTLWALPSGRKVSAFKARNDKIGHINSMAFSPDGGSVLVATGDGHDLWNIASGTEDTRFSFPGEAGNFAEFSPDGEAILTQSSRGQTYVRIWAVKSGELLHTFTGVRDFRERAMFSPNRKYILIPLRDETILAQTETYRTVHSLDRAWSDWRFSPDGEHLLADKAPNVVSIWSVEDGRLLHEFEAAIGFGLRASFLNNQSILMPPRGDSPRPQTVVAIRDIETGAQRQEIVIDVPLSDMSTIPAIAPDGKRLAIATFSGTVTLWDIQTGQQLRQFC